VYLQVSSSRNPDWANDLVRQMRSAGLPASLLDPTADGEPYRVVLGPYPSRDEADEAGRRLGRAYFIIGGPDSVPASATP
jgi:cell division septation protein DedD